MDSCEKVWGVGVGDGVLGFRMEKKEENGWLWG